MMNKTLFLLLSMAVLLVACGEQLPPHIATKFATPSPTPFLPGSSEKAGVELNPVGYTEANPETEALSQPDSNEEAVVGNTWGSFPAPTLLSDLVIPAPFPSLGLGKDYESIVILGSDQRPDDASYRTDVILLLLMNKATESVSLISFPRDLYVYQPGYKLDRINSAHLRGGAELVYLTFEYNFGIRPDHLVLVNFDGFSTIINSLGGIDVDVPYLLTDHRDGFGEYTVPAGTVTMDAETALWYVRSRGTSSDFDRGRRQQEVLTGLFLSAFSFDMLANASDIYQAYQDNVKTDISLLDFVRLAPMAGQVFSNRNIEHYAISETEVEPWINTWNAFVLVPNRESIQGLLMEASQK